MNGPPAGAAASFLIAVHCPLCGTERHRPLLEKEAHFFQEGVAHQQRFSIVRCLRCGLDYVNPRLKSEFIAHHYASHDLYVDLRGEQLEARRAYFQETLAAIQRETGAANGQSHRLLDVACSEGTFVALAREQGWKAQGVEISTPAADHGRDVLGLPIVNGTLQEADYPPGTFDVVTIQSFLEHSEEPISLLEEAHRVLKPGGLLYANVCNGRSLAAWLQGAEWYNYDPVVHLIYFSPATIRRLARTTGFRSIRTHSRGVGARFFQNAVADTSASRHLDDWYGKAGHRSRPLKVLKTWVSALLSAGGLGQTLIMLARKP